MHKKNPESPNAHLIGCLYSRKKLQTPALILDLDILELNIRMMANFARSKSVYLRPHAKTHKSIEIAHLQIKAGAIGICVATLGEAETLAKSGIASILITSPVVGDNKIDRFLSLCQKFAELLVVVDNDSNLTEIASRARSSGQIVNVVVAMDIGLQRIGTRTIEDAVELAKKIHDAENVMFCGIHAYAGNIQHIEDFSSRQKQAKVAHKKVKNLSHQLHKTDIYPEIITGAGTGTHAIDGESKIYTELQTGSYVFMDTEYQSVQMKSSEKNPFKQSLFIATTVISANHPGFVTTDAGIKWFPLGGALPKISSGAPQGSTYHFQGDEHGKVVFPNQLDRLTIGSILEVIPPHCDPTVNLYEHFHVVRGDTLVDIWNIQGRGII